LVQPTLNNLATEVVHNTERWNKHNNFLITAQHLCCCDKHCRTAPITTVNNNVHNLHPSVCYSQQSLMQNIFTKDKIHTSNYTQVPTQARKQSCIHNNVSLASLWHVPQHNEQRTTLPQLSQTIIVMYVNEQLHYMKQRLYTYHISELHHLPW